MSGRWTKWLAVSGFALLSGCASNIGHMVADLERFDASIELRDIPFHSQVTDQCGPAALATILNVVDVEVRPEELKSRIYIPERQGSLQMELLATTRHYKRIPYSIEPNVTAMLEELRSGRPVLILQNLGMKRFPIWHYAVVVGYLPEDKEFVLRSGDKKRHLMGSRSFLQAWHRADYWGIVALRSDDLPVNAVADKYLRSVAAIESVGDTATAVSADRTATIRWPQNGLAWLGLGNASYANGELDAARNAYQMLLDIEPDNVIALNNLAHVYGEQECHDHALATINTALVIADTGDALHPYLRQTLQDIERRDSTDLCL